MIWDRPKMRMKMKTKTMVLADNYRSRDTSYASQHEYRAEF